MVLLQQAASNVYACTAQDASDHAAAISRWKQQIPTSGRCVSKVLHQTKLIADYIQREALNVSRRDLIKIL